MPKTLEALRPVEHHRVMDLVSSAGIDVADWANFVGGSTKAATNPRYCYEWSFVQPHRAVVVNLWHDQMHEVGDDISVALKLRDHSDLKGVHRARAERLLSAIATAGTNHIPLRVIVNAGATLDADGAAPGSRKRRVESRLLDPIPWRVDSCDQASGECVLRRGPAVGDTLDQFSAPIDGSDPERRQDAGESFVRDPTLRRMALDRARGRCEHCGRPGFVMPSGKVFLETHHVVPLGEGGLDRAQNIVAICANDHREAHLGLRAIEMRQAMLTHLTKVLRPLSEAD